MTQDEIIEMAKEAGLHIATDVNWMPIIGLEYAKKLVELAVAKEREACANICDIGAESMLHKFKREGAARCAVAIRARGEA